MAKKKKKNKNKKKKINQKKMSLQSRLLSVFGLAMAVALLPTTILLMVGMLPTVIIAIIDRRKGTKTLTVGAMNLAGCSPFLIDLWAAGQRPEMTFEILMQPISIVVMFAGAAIGYVIDWGVSGIVATMMLQGSEQRLKTIAAQQEALVQRWGAEVTGELTLDEYGFPLEATPAQEDAPKQIEGEAEPEAQTQPNPA